MDDSRKRLLANPGFRIVRWTVPWLALGLVAYAVWGMAADFRQAKSIASGGATGTVEATSTPVTGVTGTTVVDGVHMRETPSAGGTVLKDLPKGTPLEIVESRGDWYRAKEPGGSIGWVTSDAAFVAVEKK